MRTWPGARPLAVSVSATSGVLPSPRGRDLLALLDHRLEVVRARQSRGLRRPLLDPEHEPLRDPEPPEALVAVHGSAGDERQPTRPFLLENRLCRTRRRPDHELEVASSRDECAAGLADDAETCAPDDLPCPLGFGAGRPRTRPVVALAGDPRGRRLRRSPARAATAREDEHGADGAGQVLPHNGGTGRVADRSAAWPVWTWPGPGRRPGGHIPRACGRPYGRRRQTAEPRQLGAHMSPSALATTNGPAPTRTLSTTRFEAGSMRTTRRSFSSPIQTSPSGPNEPSAGPPGIWSVATTSFVSGSIR